MSKLEDVISKITQKALPEPWLKGKDLGQSDDDRAGSELLSESDSELV